KYGVSHPHLSGPPLGPEPGHALRPGLGAAGASPARRCQILLASADGQAPSAIARALRCTSPTVRNAIHAFAREGLDCLREKSSRPHSAQPLLDGARAEPLKEILHQRPRAFGNPARL